MLAIKVFLVRAKTAKYFKSQEVDHKERKKNPGKNICLKTGKIKSFFFF